MEEVYGGKVKLSRAENSGNIGRAGELILFTDSNKHGRNERTKLFKGKSEIVSKRKEVYDYTRQNQMLLDSNNPPLL